LLTGGGRHQIGGGVIGEDDLGGVRGAEGETASGNIRSQVRPGMGEHGLEPRKHFVQLFGGITVQHDDLIAADDDAGIDIAPDVAPAPCIDRLWHEASLYKGPRAAPLADGTRDRFSIWPVVDDERDPDPNTPRKPKLLLKLSR
jgi:hypothetical protein